MENHPARALRLRIHAVSPVIGVETLCTRFDGISDHPPFPPYRLFLGAPVSSAASFAAVDGGRCSINLA